MANDNGFKRINIPKLLEDVNILDVIDELGLETRKHGSRVSILCPCHPDRHFGSCFITDFGFYCFSCHAHGNAIDLVKEVENVDFLTAARRVASVCGGENGYYLDECQDDMHTRLPKDALRIVDISDVQTVYAYSAFISDDEMLKLKMNGTEVGRNWDYEPGDRDNDNGYYFLKEPVTKKPLQELIDEDREMFDVLVYNKAVEKFERYKNLETLAKGNAFLSGIIAKELKEIQRVIDEYSKKIARYNNEELESFIYRYQPKRANPFMAIGNRF